MRILIVGTIPPPGGDSALALAEIATAFIAEGHDVELLSPDSRSAAHRSAHLEGPLLCLRLAWLSRRFEAVVLHFEEGLPLGPRAGRLWRAVTLTLLGAALRMFRESTVRFDSASPIPGGIGSRAMGEVWSAASRVVVATEQDREQVISIWGLPEERVSVAGSHPVPRVSVSSGWAVGNVEDPRIEVLELIRQRSTHDRAARAARVSLAGVIGATAESPFEGEVSRTIEPEALVRTVIALTRRLARSVSPRNSS